MKQNIRINIMENYIVRESVKNGNAETTGYPVATFDNYSDASQYIEKSENRQNLYISVKEAK